MWTDYCTHWTFLSADFKHAFKSLEMLTILLNVEAPKLAVYKLLMIQLSNQSNYYRPNSADINILIAVTWTPLILFFKKL